MIDLQQRPPVDAKQSIGGSVAVREAQAFCEAIVRYCSNVTTFPQTTELKLPAGVAHSYLGDSPKASEPLGS